MLGRNRGARTTIGETAGSVKDAVADAADAVVDYVDPLASDEKLRQRLTDAIVAGAAVRQRVRRQTGLAAFAQLAADPVLRAQLVELRTQLQAAQKRAKKARSHRFRNIVLFVSGAAMVVMAVPAARKKLTKLVRGGSDNWAPGDWTESGTSKQAAIQEEIEVAVPVATAYNQWTQFEEFPRFMEGVDEVRQLDDTLLHWAATVAGKHAEWDAKILEQQPDRRIVWESVDGKHTRGTVSFEEVAPDRSRIRLQMSYTAEGVTEKVGSAIGLDIRRIRGDLQRFRDLIEAEQVATGSWRGEIKDGVETTDEPTPN
jgi:uncharacterized membrane protein